MIQEKWHKGEFNKQGQKQKFSRVESQHEKFHAEKYIGTIIHTGHEMTLHTSINWLMDGADDMHLWEFDVKHMAWLNNFTPGWISSLTPFGIFMKGNKTCYGLECGCFMTLYWILILLQDPKWKIVIVFKERSVPWIITWEL